jgi:hypothetical protein
MIFYGPRAVHLAAIDTHEELLVGFGKRRGRARNAGARIEFVYRAVGDPSRVAVTRRLIALLETQLTRERAEVLLIHNHPRHWLKTVVRDLLDDRKPMPATSDRNVAIALLSSRIGHLLSSAGPSSFKFFLLDEGSMAEFLLPSPDGLLAEFGVP